MPDPCTFLEWDSQFFGGRIGRVNGERLDAARLSQIQAWADEHQIDGLYFLADTDDRVTVEIAEDAGWRLRDVRVTLDYDTGQAFTDDHVFASTFGLTVREGRAEDLPPLLETAREAFAQSRFFRDPHFGAGKAGRLFETWLERSILDRTFAARTLILELDGGPAGFVSCHIDVPGDSGHIGLVGVVPAYRGKGNAIVLLTEALSWYQDQKVKRVTVATQGANIAAQRLYERCGFLTREVRLWYHWWREGT